MKTKTITFNGKRYYIRGSTDDEIFEKAVAKRVELEREAERKAVCPVSVDEWFKTYMKAYKPNISQYTYKSYEGIYRNSIAPVIGCLPLSSVRPILCQQILMGLSDLSDSYIHKTYLLLRGMFTKAYENDLIESVPVKGLERPKGYKNERRALTDIERKQFLKASANGRFSGLFMQIIYYTGLRPSEVKRIRGGDYENGIIHVRGTKSKSAERDVPIPVALVLPQIPYGELLFHTVTGKEIDKKRIREYWLEIKAGLDPDTDLTPYCLRHDYCTRLQEAGVEIDVARRLMGHSDIAMTSRIYTHSSKVTLAWAGALINQYISTFPQSQKVTKQAKNSPKRRNSHNNQKAPNPLEFEAINGASRAIRTPNLLIRSDTETEPETEPYIMEDNKDE